MSLFGAKPQASAFGQPAAASGTSLFAQPANTTPAGGSGLFGQQPQQNQQQQQQPQQQQQQQTSAFGTSSLFAPQPQQQQQSGFMGASQAPVQQQPQQGLLRSSIWSPGQESTHQKPVLEQMTAVYKKWDPNSPNTVFKHYFYNKVEEAHVPFYQPGPNEDLSDWEQAVREKPGKEYIPALATGFTAVAERLKTQRIILAHFNSMLHAINGSLDAILAKHDLETSVRALNAKRKHALIRQRCLAVASKVQVLRNRGYALDTDEDELKSKLEALDRGLADPSLSARTEELWSRLIMLRRHADTLRDEVNQRGGESGDGISEEAEAKAKKLLEDYDKQLQTLKTMVEKAKEDYEEWERESGPNRK